MEREMADQLKERKHNVSWRSEQPKDMERLHPQSWQELRQLVKLHGAQALIRAIQHIEDHK